MHAVASCCQRLKKESRFALIKLIKKAEQHGITQASVANEFGVSKQHYNV